MQVAIVGLDIAKRESRTAHRKVWKDLAHHQERSSVDFIRAESSGHAVAGVNPDFIGQEGQRLPALARSFGTDFVRTCALFPAAGAGQLPCHHDRGCGKRFALSERSLLQCV